MLVDNIVQKYISDNKCDDYHKIIKPFIVDAVARSEYGAGGSGPICLSPNITSNFPTLSR